MMIKTQSIRIKSGEKSKNTNYDDFGTERINRNNEGLQSGAQNTDLADITD